jgi:hypothetical protein
MTFKENGRNQYSKKKNRKKQKCKKGEYFNKKERVCKKKTKSKKSIKKRYRKSKKKRIVSIPFTHSSTLENLSNSLHGFNPNLVKSVPKKTRIFLIMGHSSLCTFKELRNIEKGKEKSEMRLDLKAEPLKRFNNLRIVNFQSISLNKNVFVYILRFLLSENEKFYSAFIQMNSIEKADFLDKFMKYLYLKKNTFGGIKLSEDTKKKILDMVEGNVSSFKIYPKPENEDYPQNPLKTSYTFYPNSEIDDSFMKWGLYELTVPNYKELDNSITILGDEYKINPIFYNNIIKNIYEKHKKLNNSLNDPELLKVSSFLGILDDFSMDILSDLCSGKQIEEFKYFIRINNKIFEEIKKRYDKSGDIRNAAKFTQEELLNIAFSEAYIQEDDKIIFLDGGCKGIHDLHYSKNSTIIPSMGRWESSIRFDPKTTGPLGYNSTYTKEHLPHKFRGIFDKTLPYI